MNTKLHHITTTQSYSLAARKQFQLHKNQNLLIRDLTDSESESNRIRQFFKDPKSDKSLKYNRVGFQIFAARCVGFGVTL